MRIAKRRLRIRKIKQAAAKMRGVRQAVQRRSPACRRFYFPSVRGESCVFAFRQGSPRPFGRSSRFTACACLGGARSGVPQKTRSVFRGLRAADACFKTGTRLTTIYTIFAYYISNTKAILQIQKVHYALYTEQVDEF